MKLTFFEKLEQYQNSSKEVYINNIYQDENLTYKNLIEYSDKLAFYLAEKQVEDKNPIVV